MSKHTPGPWGWYKLFLVQADESGSIPLNAKMIMKEAPEFFNDFDSSLIAAAPDLLSIVKKLAYNEGMVGEESFRKQMWPEMMAIIAKAEGNDK